MNIKPFTINIEQSALDDLQSKLKQTRWTEGAEKLGWEYGTSAEYLRELTNYWIKDYDWRKHEAELNKLAHFKANIQDKEIHFIHERSKNPNATPLLLLHGWPDSFYRFHKIIPLLTEKFHIVVPSLPGFGFSSHDGMSGDATAEVMATLMDGLGYKKYVVAGEDLGLFVALAMGVMYPDNVAALHLTQANYPTGQEDLSILSEVEQKYVKATQQWLFTKGAYLMIQSTKPQSLAQALHDSPTGLASWMISYIDTTAENHKIEEAFGSKDELLTNMTLYWVTETIGSAIRTYAENTRLIYTQPGGPKSSQKSTVPTFISLFPRDVPFPKEWAERTLNVKKFTHMSKGGHFAALEVPELYANALHESLEGII